MTQFGFNPYGGLAHREPDAAVFDVGRRLQRLRFHLQQAWLLGDEEGVLARYPATRFSQTASQIRWTACQRQFQRADDVFAHLSTAIYSIDPNDPGWLSERIRLHARELVDEAFPERCYEIFEDLRSCYRPDTREQQYQEFIDQNVGVGFQQLRQDIRSSIADNHRQFLLAGMVLEEGLCRSDVHNYLPSPTADVGEVFLHGSLDYEIEALEAREGKPVEDWESYEVGALSDLLERGNPTKRRVDHESGQLRPDPRWPSRLLATWKHAGFSAHHLSHILGRSFHRQPLTKVREAIDELYEHACRQLSSTVGCDRLKVDIANLTLTLDGIQHRLSPQAAYLFAELLKAPDGQMPFTQIRGKYPEVFGSNDRLNLIVKNLPREIGDILKSGKGKPCQIKLP